MPRGADLDVTARYFLGKHGLHLDRYRSVVRAFQVYAAHPLPRFLRCLRIVIMGGMMFETLCPLISLRIREVTVQCLSRSLCPKVITLDRVDCQRDQGRSPNLLTLYSNHGADGAISPIDIQGAVIYTRLVTPPALPEASKSGASKPFRASGAMKPPAECMATVTSWPASTTFVTSSRTACASSKRVLLGGSHPQLGSLTTTA